MKAWLWTRALIIGALSLAIMVGPAFPAAAAGAPARAAAAAPADRCAAGADARDPAQADCQVDPHHGFSHTGAGAALLRCTRNASDEQLRPTATATSALAAMLAAAHRWAAPVAPLPAALQARLASRRVLRSSVLRC